MVDVSQRSNAARTGLARGDVIVEVNGKNITDLDDKTIEAAEAAPYLTLEQAASHGYAD